MLVFFLLFLLLINPDISKTEIINQKPSLSVLADNSSSILFLKKDTLVKSIVDHFKKDKDFTNKFDVSYYSFGNQLQLNDSLRFDESQTNILKPLQKINNISNIGNHAIVLLTDGNQTLGNTYEYTNIKTPVYPIVIGDTTQYEDVAISQLNHNRYSFINNQFPVETFLQYTGNRSVKLRFTIENRGKIIFSKYINFSKEENSLSFLANIKATSKGLNTYKAHIQYVDNEKNTNNNSKNFSIEVLDKQSKILLVSSIYHPDIGTLKKSIESDKQRNVSIKIINNKKIQINGYQLVILYQPNNKFKYLINEINRNKIPYFLVTGSKTDWSFLNRQGLGFEKKYINQIEEYSTKMNPNYLNFHQKDIGFDNFPPLVDQFGSTTISIPHQTLLFQKINGFSTQEPLLITALDDNQKKAFLFGEGLWKWRSASYLYNGSFQSFDEFIGNLIQYISTKKIRNRLDVDIETMYNANSSIKIGAFYVDNNYQFDDRATLFCSVLNTNTKEKYIYPFVLKDNSYQLELSSLESGEYEYNVSVENQNISKKGIFKINEFNVEEQFRVANKEKLEKLADKTSGKLYFENQYKQLIDGLLTNQRFLTLQKSIDSTDKLINWQWIMFLIISLLSMEWFIRKYYGKI